MLKTIAHGVKIAVSMAAAVLFFASLGWAANNIFIVGQGGTAYQMKTTETSGVHLPHVSVDSWAGATLGLTSALGSSPGAVTVPSFNTHVLNLAADACAGTVWTRKLISVTADTELITGVSSTKIYVCHLHVMAEAAERVSFVEGTGSVCATGTAGITGAASAANGQSIAANGGFQMTAGGRSIAETAGTNVNLCILKDGADRITGIMSYVQQ
jgi:hypothetical protein